jgi:hypothetical protein
MGEARQVPKSFPLVHWISLSGLPAIFQLRLIGLCVTLEGLLDTPERLIGSSPSFLGFGVILFESTTSFEPPLRTPFGVKTFESTGRLPDAQLTLDLTQVPQLRKTFR